MSMPKIEIAHIEREDAVNNIIASIALQEAAIAHVLNAEGEKIQAAAAIYDITPRELTELNRSVSDVIDGLRALEQELKSKLRLVLPECGQQCGCECGCKPCNCCIKICLPCRPCNTRRLSKRWYWRTQNFC